MGPPLRATFTGPELRPWLGKTDIQGPDMHGKYTRLSTNRGTGYVELEEPASVAEKNGA
jgi:hypothetical protein